MAEDWAIDVRRYAPNADDAVVAGIVRHCGIALRSRDASLVSFIDPAETERVRESFCKKKLGLTDPDDVLDAAIASVGERMQADPTKNRVTVYYLLAEHFGKLALFGGAAVASAAEPDPEPVIEPVAPVLPVAAVPPPPPPPVIAPAAAGPVMATPVMAAAVVAPAQASEPEDVVTSTGLIALGVVGAAVVAAALGGLVITGGDVGGSVAAAPAGAPILPAGASTTGAPNSGPPVSLFAPSGAAAIAQEVDGKPMVSVYFVTASAVVVPDFASAAAPIKAWLDAHPGDRLAVSGYNDPRGDAAMNAELSKNRAQSVAAALAALGIAPEAIDLEKPPETTDMSGDYEQARRVDIMVKEGG